MASHLDSVKDYYGKVLQSKQDLKTTACCSAESMPEHLRTIAAQIHPEVLARFYGCGVPIPAALEGLTVLDLGCGTGRDCFILSKLVGERGQVIGVDMTDEQLALARTHQQYHAEKFGLPRSNVSFRQGYIEDLKALDISDASIDLVVSNCVFNLSPDKERLYREVLRVLKPGGEIYFSDVFCDRRLSSEARTDPVLLGECLGGAMYVEDFRRLMGHLGVHDVRAIKSSPVDVRSDTLHEKVNGARFSSITMRVFKLELEDRCEDYGQVAYYRGGITECPTAFELDDHHLFVKDKPMLVCSNTAAMVTESRFGRFFEVIGDTSQHFGLFDCAPSASAGADKASGGGCC